MSGYGYSEGHRPVTYWRGYPIYAAHLLVAFYCALMVVVAVLGRSAYPIFEWLGFASAKVFAGQAWRFFSYGLFNPPSLSFAIDMLMLVWFGGELERSFGRKIYTQLYVGIYLAPVLVLTFVGLFRPTAAFGQPGALALFIAFATYFPGAPVFFTLLAKWAALALVGIYSLIALSDRNWTALILLWSTCGYAHAFVRYQQGHLPLPDLRFWQRQPKLRVLPDLPTKPAPAAKKSAPVDPNMAEIDALLDKIATSGLGSLTVKERAQLEAARHDLRKRGADRNT
ncbi:MAG: rhomboid family intramembrane serine protease [Opitutaceae bacterium]